MLRPFAQTRVLIDYDWFADNLGDGVLICTSQGVLNVIRMLIRSYGMREANWVTAYSVAGYTGVSQGQFDLIDSEISQFLEETNEMGFCTELTDVLQSLSGSIAGAGCGCGSVGSGSTAAAPSTNQPGVPGNPQPGDEVPPGFADYAEYNAYKCDVAEWLVQQVESDLGWWQGANFVTITLQAFIAAMVTPIPGDEILTAMGLLLALALQGVQIAGVGFMQDAIANNRDDYLCALFQGGNAGDSTSNLVTVISNSIDGETSAIYAPLLKSILAQMFNADNVNRLYVKWEEKEPSLPTGDCDSCLCEHSTNIGTDNGGGNWDTEHWVPADDPPGEEVVNVEWKNGSGGNCEVNNVVITPTNINPGAGPQPFQGYQFYDASDVLIYNDDSVPPSTDGVHKLVVQSQTVGEIDVTWTT